MRLRIGLALWILCILFPLAFVSQVSPRSKDFMDWLLEPEWLHVIMHLAIYAGLAILLAGALRREGRALSPLALIGVVIMIGVAQELLQFYAYGAARWHLDDVRAAVFDLGVDLIGGLGGLLIFNRFSTLRRRRDTLSSR